MQFGQKQIVACNNDLIKKLIFKILFIILKTNDIIYALYAAQN